MLTYPKWFTALDKQPIKEALDTAYRLRTVPSQAGVIRIVWLSEDVAIRSALIVLEAIASVLYRACDRQPVTARRRGADSLCAEVIVGVYQARGWTTTLNEFTEAVKTALDANPVWQELQTTLLEPAPTVKGRKRRSASAQLKTTRAVVYESLEEADWTPTKWAFEAGVNPSVTLDYLEGISTPRKPYRARLTRVLADILKQPTFRLPD